MEQIQIDVTTIFYITSAFVVLTERALTIFRK